MFLFLFSSISNHLISPITGICIYNEYLNYISESSELLSYPRSITTSSLPINWLLNPPHSFNLLISPFTHFKNSIHILKDFNYIWTIISPEELKELSSILNHNNWSIKYTNNINKDNIELFCSKNEMWNILPKHIDENKLKRIFTDKFDNQALRHI